MISRSYYKSVVVIGKIKIPSEPIIENVVCFIDKYLPAFPDFLSQCDFTEESEKLINQQLVDYFNGCSRSESYEHNTIESYYFIFRKDDEMKGTNSKPDVGVVLWTGNKSSPISFFQIECKRLPIPNVSSQRSEKEYVKGINEDGAIERFKRGRHGAHINFGAIVGYVQNNTIEFWHSTICGWIKELISKLPDGLIWNDEDLLVISKKISGKLTKYNAKHIRTDGGDSINVYHYLVDIN